MNKKLVHTIAHTLLLVAWFYLPVFVSGLTWIFDPLNLRVAYLMSFLVAACLVGFSFEFVVNPDLKLIKSGWL